jgi:hypothetical protein
MRNNSLATTSTINCFRHSGFNSTIIEAWKIKLPYPPLPRWPTILGWRYFAC